VKLALNIAFGLAVSAAVLYGAWRVAGPFGLVLTAPVLAILARPIVDIVTGYPRFVARLALRRYEGRYYAYRGRHMDIHIDAEARCWIATQDVRKITALPADAVLCRLLPADCRELGEPASWRITTEGAAQVLAKSSDPEVARFRAWLERDVALPARKRRERGMALR
jgi:hypothetical protein